MSKKIYIIAGEASGDLHGFHLINALKKGDENILIRSWGGDLMASVSTNLVKHIKELAFMGFIEVVLNLKKILNNIKYCKKDILAYKPDAIVLIDYPGFNLRIAKWAHKNNIKVYYYISPQVWAWKKSRVYDIKKYVNHMFTILPFEEGFYKQYAYPIHYVGHPLIDAIDYYSKTKKDYNSIHSDLSLDSTKKTIALLPGSRKQEILSKLPIMLDAIKDLADYNIVIACAPAIENSLYEQFQINSSVKLVSGKTYDLLSIAHAALVTSGTATLETALFDVPQVVCYKASKISYEIAKKLVKINYISLVNLISNKEVVKELIQHECNPPLIQKYFYPLLNDGEERNKMLSEYQEMRKLLGNGGASEKVAHFLLKTI